MSAAIADVNRMTSGRKTSMRDTSLEYWERKQLEGELNFWGRWVERHADYEGYPGIDVLEAFLSGRGGGTGGHKILCLDMPTGVYVIHARVLRLPEKEQEAITVRYCVKVKGDGTLWTEAELCLKSGIEPDSFRRRLSRAKRRLMGLPID